MKLGELARLTEKLDARETWGQYPDPALIFLTPIARPEGDVREALAAPTAPHGVKLDGFHDPGSTDLAATTLDDESGPASAPDDVTGDSIVLFLKKRKGEPADGVRLGRGPESDYSLPLPTVSKSHAVFLSTPTGWTLTDSWSTNGTFLDGREFAPGESAKLADGALIRFGPETVARFFTPQGLYGFLKLFRLGAL